MLKIQVLGEGMIPRGNGIAPRKEPFYADTTLIGIIMQTPGLKINYLDKNGEFKPLTRNNVRAVWDEYVIKKTSTQGKSAVKTQVAPAAPAAPAKPAEPPKTAEPPYQPATPPTPPTPPQTPPQTNPPAKPATPPVQNNQNNNGQPKQEEKKPEEKKDDKTTPPTSGGIKPVHNDDKK